jgi:predicted transcriptional regulator
VDTDALLGGAPEMMDVCLCRPEDYTNPACVYAAARSALYRAGKIGRAAGCL